MTTKITIEQLSGLRDDLEFWAGPQGWVRCALTYYNIRSPDHYSTYAYQGNATVLVFKDGPNKTPTEMNLSHIQIPVLLRRRIDGSRVITGEEVDSLARAGSMFGKQVTISQNEFDALIVAARDGAAKADELRKQLEKVTKERDDARNGGAAIAKDRDTKHTAHRAFAREVANALEMTPAYINIYESGNVMNGGIIDPVWPCETDVVRVAGDRGRGYQALRREKEALVTRAIEAECKLEKAQSDLAALEEDIEKAQIFETEATQALAESNHVLRTKIVNWRANIPTHVLGELRAVVDTLGKHPAQNALPAAQSTKCYQYAKSVLDNLMGVDTTDILTKVKS